MSTSPSSGESGLSPADRIYMPTGEHMLFTAHYIGIMPIRAIIGHLFIVKGESIVMGSPVEDGTPCCLSLLAWIFDEDTGAEVFNIRKYQGPVTRDTLGFLLGNPRWPSEALKIDPPRDPGEMYFTRLEGSELQRGKGCGITRNGQRLVCFACGWTTKDLKLVAARTCEKCRTVHPDPEGGSASGNPVGQTQR
jgi:hypothetical protein